MAGKKDKSQILIDRAKDQGFVSDDDMLEAFPRAEEEQIVQYTTEAV